MENPAQEEFLPQALPEAPKRRKRKILKWFLISIVVLIVIFFTLPYALGLFFRDTKSVDDDDLQLTVVTIPTEDNAYYDLEKIASTQNQNFDSNRLAAHLAGTEWNEVFVADVLKKNEEALIHFDAAAAKLYYQDPASADPADYSPYMRLPNLNAIRTFSRLSQLKAEQLRFQGKNKEAIEESIKSIEIGQKMQDSQGTLIQILVAMAVKTGGLEELHRILKKASLSPSEANVLAERLEKYKENEEGMKRVFKVEYIFTVHATDLIVEGNLDEAGEVGSMFRDEETGFDASKLTRFNFYFQPNNTKQLFADSARLRIRNVEKPCWLLKEERGTPSPIPEFPLAVYFTENSIGKLLYHVTHAGLNTAIIKKCEEDMLVSAAQALAAIRAYYLEQGKYPATLQELVPKYVSKVPEDPFDGQDIKYSPTKRIIYSVGADGKDAGGSEGKEWRRMPDPTFSLDFN